MNRIKFISLIVVSLLLSIRSIESYGKTEGEIIEQQPNESVEIEQLPNEKVQKELFQVNHQIHSLGDLKNFYAAKVERLKLKGDRFQFQGSIIEAQRSWNNADEYQQIVEKITGELDNLKEEKHELENQLFSSIDQE